MSHMDTLIDALIRAALVIVAIAAPVLGGYVVLILHRVAKKYGLEVSAQEDQQLRAGVQNVILGVEEAARARFLKNGNPIPSQTKLDVAIQRVMVEVPGRDREDVKELIEQELPKARAVAAAAPSPVVTVPAAAERRVP
jgi:hypothetical protein